MTLPPSSNGGANHSSRVLIIGAAGFIGQFIAEASLNTGHSTFILLRSIPSCPAKARALKGFEDKGATIIHGAINNQELMEKILKEHKIDIVISAVGGANILDQLVLIRAILDVGTIKRFLPSEFGHDVARADPVEPGLSLYNEKRKVRRVVEDAGIPYTYICCNSIASWPYYDNTHPSEVSPPLDHFQIYGDGSMKAYFVAGPDIGKFTIKAAGDVRTQKKSLHFRPSCNYLNINELASLWEKKIGRTLPRITVSEDHLLDAGNLSVTPAATHHIQVDALRCIHDIWGISCIFRNRHCKEHDVYKGVELYLFVHRSKLDTVFCPPSQDPLLAFSSHHLAKMYYTRIPRHNIAELALLYFLHQLTTSPITSTHDAGNPYTHKYLVVV